MKKSNLFEFDGNIEFKQNNEYAKKYNNWRRKEELNKIKLKYGDINVDETESSSSEDDEDGTKLTEEVEKKFFQTLSYLKKKDPKIYDNQTRFFIDVEEKDSNIKPKKKKEHAMFLKDYERKLLLENNGIPLDDKEVENFEQSPGSLNAEQEIKKEIKNALSQINENEENEIEMFTKEHNKSSESAKAKHDYKSRLIEQNYDVKNAETEEKLIEEICTDSNLDEGEKFLRDYILNKKYLEAERKDYVPSYDEIIHDSDEGLSEDEWELERQEDFEHKFNYRFEEPDPEFIKRYPRTIENSVRKSDNRRKIKRAETKLRKLEEKKMKMAEITKLKELKKKEIEEKIEKLKEITGNADIGLCEKVLQEDFDPEDYDKKMNEIFNNDFYAEPEDRKPQFSEFDEELQIENWDDYETATTDFKKRSEENQGSSHIEDFNMDADYDESAPKSNETKRRKSRRKSKVAEALSKPKPKYNPEDKNFEKYFDEYYKLDCEDVIGDLPCRFKYRKVEPNSFGLTLEEILLAKDRELNRWCSLKKTLQHRSEYVEKYDQIAYAKKAKNLALKKKILPSLFVEEENNTEQNDKHDESWLSKKSSNNQKKDDDDVHASQSNERKLDVKTDTVELREEDKIEERKQKATEESNRNGSNESNDLKKNRKRSHSTNEIMIKKKRKYKENVDMEMSDIRLSAYGINPKKYKNKLKYKK